MLHKTRARNARPYGHGVTYCLDGKYPDKELPLRGSWHGAAVTEGVRLLSILIFTEKRPLFLLEKEQPF